MVTKTKKADEKEEKKGRLKVGKLKLNKETVKDLNADEKKQIKGGMKAKFSYIGCTNDQNTQGNCTVIC
jgi:hypothetical protein